MGLAAELPVRDALAEAPLAALLVPVAAAPLAPLVVASGTFVGVGKLAKRSLLRNVTQLLGVEMRGVGHGRDGSDGSWGLGAGCTWWWRRRRCIRRDSPGYLVVHLEDAFLHGVRAGVEDADTVGT